MSSGSRAIIWIGRVLSGVVVLMMLFGAGVKLAKQPPVVDGFAKSGLPERLIVPVGAIELISVILYAIPATAVLGAILLTGVMGGAILTNLRVGDPSYIAAIIVGLVAWGALYLRDEKVRGLIPFRR